MRALTVLWYALATFFLATIAVVTGGIRAVALILGQGPGVGDWERGVMLVTACVSAAFLVFAVYYAFDDYRHGD